MINDNNIYYIYDIESESKILTHSRLSNVKIIGDKWIQNQRLLQYRY